MQLYRIRREEFDWVKFLEILEQLVDGNDAPAPAGRPRQSSFYERHYFTACHDDHVRQFKSFENELSRAPPLGPQFRVSRHRLKQMTIDCRQCRNRIRRNVQAGVDVGIATCFLTQCFQQKADEVVLLTGDVDFEDALKAVRDGLQKRVTLVGFIRNQSMSSTLQAVAEKVIWLDEPIDHVDGLVKGRLAPPGRQRPPGAAVAAPPVPALVQEAAQPDPWVCRVCTLHNDGGRFCQACENQRGATTHFAAAPAGNGAQAADGVIDLSEDEGPGPPAPAEGQRSRGCPQCTFERETPDAECLACGYEPGAADFNPLRPAPPGVP